MKHYPPSSGIPRGESYRATKGHSAVWNWCSVDVLSERVAVGWKYSTWFLAWSVFGLKELCVAFIFLWFFMVTLSLLILWRLLIHNHVAVDLLKPSVMLEQPKVLFTCYFYFLNCIKFRVFIPVASSVNIAAGFIRGNTSFASRFISSFCVFFVIHYASNSTLSSLLNKKAYLGTTLLMTCLEV